MKLWNKNIKTNQDMLDFTIGKDAEYDIQLLPYDVEASIAHAKMLQKINLLSKDELQDLLNGFGMLKGKIEEGDFSFMQNMEDGHSAIENFLVIHCGENGKKIHTGRSRNDQVLVALRLFYRDQLVQLEENLTILKDILSNLAEKYMEIFLPGYTHFQVAMPSSFGNWFFAYAESVTDDLQLAKSVQRIINKNPLGSAAGYGSNLPLDKQFTSELLGFDDFYKSPVYAQMTRGKTEKMIAAVMDQVAGTISKLSMDLVLYLCNNFDFISFPEEITTGSSIMPHKKNPDVFELIRAKCNKIQTLPAQLNSVLQNLPSGYHRDLQELKGLILDDFSMLHSCLQMMINVLPEIQVNEKIESGSLYKNIRSVEKVNELVLSGKSFRDAYREVADKIIAGDCNKTE